MNAPRPSMLYITRVFCANHYVHRTYSLTQVTNRKGKRVVYVNYLT